jgi:hypothetical protein
LESCRLEKTALLLARAQEFLKERRVIFPAESALLRLVGEQKKLAHESIVTRIADSFSPEMAETIARSRDLWNMQHRSPKGDLPWAKPKISEAT